MTLFEPLHQLGLRLRSYNAWEVLLELAILWFGVYTVWRFVRGARGAAALRGIFVIILLTLALWLVMPAERFQRLAYLYDKFLAFAALAFVIIFQPELRRGMIRLGEAPFFRTGAAHAPRVVDAIVNACEFLSKNKFGAIAAIERQVGLRETVEGGRALNADISAELLQSIFWPNNPLHDLGVVIKGDKVVAAGVQFPLAEPEEMPDPNVGSRHRAAVGLSRVSDALVVVVSEETGVISLAHQGRLVRGLTPATLRAELLRHLLAAPEAAGAAPTGKRTPVAEGSRT